MTWIRQTLRTKILPPFARCPPGADPPVADAGRERQLLWARTIVAFPVNGCKLTLHHGLWPDMIFLKATDLRV